MSPLNHSRLFRLLAEPSQQETGAEVMLHVYSDFVEQLIFYCNQEAAPTLLYQYLHDIRIEFESLKAMEEFPGSEKK